MALQPFTEPEDDLGRHPLYDSIRLTTTVKPRLGVKKTKGDKEYPAETDYFVLKEEDGATAEIRKLYGEAPKELRLMLPFEAPLPGRRQPTDDLVLSINNTAWAWNSGLLCKGTGASLNEPGMAEATDEDFARRIARQIGAEVQPTPEGRFRIPCHGIDCPKYRHMKETQEQEGGRLKRVMKLAPGHDPDASCKLTILFKALLLHPTDPDPSNILGVAEIASGSINTIRDVIAGFALMREFTKSVKEPDGRTRLIPFRLIRKPTVTTVVARRVHFTLAIAVTPKEWQKYADRNTREMFLSPEAIAELKALREADFTLDTVKDIIPRPLELAAAAGTDFAELEKQTHGAPSVPQGTPPTTADAEEAASAAAGPPQAEPSHGDEDPELNRGIGRADIAALKDLCGGREDPNDVDSPSKPGTLEKLYGLLHEYERLHGERIRRLSDMKVRHQRFVMERLGVAQATPDAGGENDDEIPEAAEPTPAAAETPTESTASPVATVDNEEAARVLEAQEKAQAGEPQEEPRPTAEEAEQAGQERLL